ncbi:MAG: RagB/SusD family nutrient uptake outer membrane protein [Longimicrobiales bacterium]
MIRIMKSARTLTIMVAFCPLLAATACDSLLEVELPGTVPATSLDNPALARTLVNSALGRFECAYTSYVITTGVLSNEFINASTWLNLNTWGWKGLELHTIAGGCPGGRDDTGIGAYTPLQQARYLAEEGARRIEGFQDNEVPNKSEMLAQLYAYAGFATVLLGEGYCEMALDLGPLMPLPEVFARAEQRFTTAITHAQAARNTNLELLATAGRARARLDKKDLANAAVDAEKIPDTFTYNAEYSTVNGIRENRVFNLNRRNRYLSVEPTAYANLQVGAVADRRVNTTDSGLRGHDDQTRHFFQNKYNTAAAPIPMASWFEAQLILAEARPSEAVAAINRIRAKQSLPAVTPGGDVLAMVIEERRRQLFAEGHRLNDMLRHRIAFPTGFNHKGQAWGPITCMPLPDQEKLNNPNLQ